ncbi:protein translocase subunit secY/sec61 alpha [Hydrogenoanaerobacterium saccharovorans]|uniref:Protein translocase subunit SecY n=1 Tax=Hydrogenoanaerobacterium saccharovorans TaxID=474960 RepID=A0A1H8CSL8_9FIRM|nr:preprotein translocase subunit SecY [Hydrogenoanaerobacterium saccharovorans]RPF43302.1 protein translocase subunit secY/sec61 alpha [Hydrogenoanaerobacterium saccharovorans]SEM98221.1 protein translocase subunit secY/sec61 alpha [Hydrogenoanaerobacterium saccharovorans]
MFSTLRNAWRIADIRKKLLYTLMILIIFRVGSAIPVPFLDPSVLKEMVSTQGSLLGYIDILTGGAFANATIFAMSISPYITSSIVIQLLTIAIPALERLAKEGEEGRKQIQKITRYTAVGLALVQATAYFIMLRNLGALTHTQGFAFWFSAIVIISTFTAGACLIIWLGERIDERGIGNGISMMLFAGIVSRGPAAAMKMWTYIKLANEGETQYYFLVPAVLVLFVAIIGFIVLMTNAERRIPVQYAKRVVGRKMYGGQSTHIPIKVNMSGVLPIIFASALLSIPGTIKGFVYTGATANTESFMFKFLSLFDYNNIAYAILYFLLIIAFNYFYVAVQYNPIEMANNLQKNNGGIPGIRPGRPTSEFIAKVISKITLIGALFLAVIAILPIGLGALTKMNISLGGTSVLILVGVALDTMRQLESQMMMRHYKGFLE